MEIFNPSEYKPDYGLKTLEKPEKVTGSGMSLKIGLPKECSNDERRISLTPGGVSVLIANGHEVHIERDAGMMANFPDHEYSEVGAQICENVDDLYKKCELILKVAPPHQRSLI